MRLFRWLSSTADRYYVGLEHTDNVNRFFRYLSCLRGMEAPRAGYKMISPLLQGHFQRKQRLLATRHLVLRRFTEHCIDLSHALTHGALGVVQLACNPEMWTCDNGRRIRVVSSGSRGGYSSFLKKNQTKKPQQPPSQRTGYLLKNGKQYLLPTMSEASA